MAKKARPVREDHLERQENAEELHERIRVLSKLKQTPDDKHVKFLLSRLENIRGQDTSKAEVNHANYRS